MTIEEIHNKEFSRKVRGYHEIEVDEFLDKVAIDISASNKKIAALEERIRSLEAEVQDYRKLEHALRDTMINAQRSADDTLQNAQRNAAMVMQQAEDQAEKMVAEAEKKRDDIAAISDGLQSRFDAFRQEAIMVMRRQIDELSQALQNQV